MSANLELVRSIYEPWERGDFRETGWADPGIEFVLADGPDPMSATGLAEMVELFIAGLLSTWDGLRTEAQEYRELDDERILVYIHNSGRGKASGISVAEVMGTAEGANLFVIRRGRVVKLVLYWSRERALADLGLTSED